MSDPESVSAELRKIANLLALQQIRDLTKGDAARVLSLSGFSTRDIAALINTSEGSVRGLLSAGRKRSSTEP